MRLFIMRMPPAPLCRARYYIREMHKSLGWKCVVWVFILADEGGHKIYTRMRLLTPELFIMCSRARLMHNFLFTSRNFKLGTFCS
jgi:hypothetical protein